MSPGPERVVRVTRYTAAQEREWNDFVARSKNGTFLFDRGYMEYHADRFEDSSLIVHDGHDRLIALFPASRHDDVLVSHGGLTYGGLVSDTQMTTRAMLDVFDACLEYIGQDGIARLVYKCVPHIYHLAPAEEDAYALFVRDARLVRRDVSSVIDARAPRTVRHLRLRMLKRARGAGLRVEQTDDFDDFWPLLERTLLERHARRPVHTIDEIKYIASRFPDNVVHLACTGADATLAGVVLYLSENVCHVQYSAASDDGRRVGALDLVLSVVIERFSSQRRWIDFGISTEREGRYLNQGLVDYKEGLGARAVNYDAYELRVG